MIGRRRGQFRLCLLLMAAWSYACSDAHTDRAHDSGALTDEEQEWAAATDFEIGLSTTACYGTCPIYTATVRAPDQFRFTGRAHVWKPGTYEVQLPRETVAKLYFKLIRRGFLGLQERYQTLSDGCPEVWTDQPSSTFTLRAAGREKIVKYYQGCRGDSPALETLRAMEREIIEMADLQPFLQISKVDCGSPTIQHDTSLEPSYVLSDSNDEPIGILRFAPNDPWYQQNWVVATCDGEELASADRMWSRDCGPVLASANESMLKWPGMDAPQAAVAIYPADGEPSETAKKIELRLFTFDVDSTQHGEPGDRCR